jgi:glycosyltransferase involved in cell wall biosynthesis
MSGSGLVSVVLSFRNEAENIPTLVARLDAVFARDGAPYELLFVNDASTDASLEILMKERQRNPRVKILNLSRRFGVAEGVLAGMAAASGDAAIYMDSDLQDPPEMIPALLAGWRSGADVVHTVRTRRHGENALKMWATAVAYRLIQSGSSVELPVDAGDFKLLSRLAIDHLLRLPESDPYLRGLVVWMGFNQAFVPYERDARHAGRTHFPFFSRNPWKTFINGMTSFSFLPIYLLGGLAAVGLLASAALLASGLVALAVGAGVGRTAWLAGVLAFMWATTMSAVAIVGVYVARIYKDVRRRPAYIVASAVGVGGHAPVRVDESERAGP